MTTVLSVLLIAILAAAGGAWRRWFGSGIGRRRWPKLAAGIALGFAAAWDMGLGLDSLIFAGLTGAAMALVWTPGHGSYMTMGRNHVPDNEVTAPLVSLLVGPRVPASPLARERFHHRRDLVGMALRYGLPMAALAVLFVAFGRWWGLLLPVAGAAVAGVYWLAWELDEWLPDGLPDWRPGGRPVIEGPLSYAELATGALVYGVVAGVG